MNEIDIQNLRLDYSKHSLDADDVEKDPLNQFKKWFTEAIESNVLEPNAFNLATVDKHNHPKSRIVLLKGLESGIFRFFTNYESDKGKDLALNKYVSICFFWKELERQIRIQGTAEKLSTEESELYFKSRPYLSQIGAHSSHQSEIVPNRDFLDEQFQHMLSKYSEGNVPLPDTWGGYGITPTYFEFWQGRPSRLHDRISYKWIGNTWDIKRLSP